MPKTRAPLVALVASFFTAGAWHAVAAEKTIDFNVDGQKVVGTLAVPDRAAKPPVVLLLHGFTGSRDELEIPAVKEGIFERAARMWSEKGLASLRIDFRGSGESDGKFEDTTVDGQVKDALAAIDFLAASSEVDGSKIAIVGWSMGGAVASAAAGRTTHPLTSVSVWAPGTNMGSAVTFLLGPEFVKKGLASGDSAVTTKLPWGADVTLKAAFFQSLYTVDPVAEITRYKGPLLVAVGTRDDVVFPQPAAGQILLDYHDGPEELWVRPMDHAFNAFEGTETVDELIAKTADFVAAGMK